MQLARRSIIESFKDRGSFLIESFTCMNPIRTIRHTVRTPSVTRRVVTCAYLYSQGTYYSQYSVSLIFLIDEKISKMIK